MKHIIEIIIKRIISSLFVLYGYNLLVSPLNIVIPINFITLSVLSTFGIPGLFMLTIIFICIS